MKKNLIVFDVNDVRIERNNEGVAVVSSRIIAEQLGKRHADTLEQIGKILTNGDFRSLIISSEYKDAKGEMRKEYLLTEEGFTLYMSTFKGIMILKWHILENLKECNK